MSSFDQCEFTQFTWRDLRRKVVTCAKPHDCHICGGSIEARQQAISFAYLSEDRGFIHGHCCLQCSIDNHLIKPKA